jgi:Flp pilus assembly protein TadD
MAKIKLTKSVVDTAQAQKAVSAYERSLSIAPDNALVLTDLGIMQRELGQFDKAVASFRKAFRKWTGNAPSHYRERAGDPPSLPSPVRSP